MLIWLIPVIFFSCNSKQESFVDTGPDLYELNRVLDDVVVSDGFTAPVAARIYAYCHWAGYEVMRLQDTLHWPRILGDQGVEIPSNDFPFKYCRMQLFMMVAKDLVYRDYLIDSAILFFKSKYPLNRQQESAVSNLSLKLYKLIRNRMVSDFYRETRTLPRFIPSSKEGHWEPTPPMFAEAVEPHFMRLKPFLIHGPQSFSIPSPPPYSLSKNSQLYIQAEEVRQILNQEDSLRKHIADYWDDNPFRTQVKGHAMYAMRQLTPGGHWIGIGIYAGRTAAIPEAGLSLLCALNSMIITDAFICCWNEKYKFDFIRPETYINRNIDGGWKPFIETPPFPEYPSGHSTVSSASAALLTELFGTQFKFVDSSELAFEMNARKFNSFVEAAREAGESRIYGGIHFRSACEQGFNLGKSIADSAMHRHFDLIKALKRFTDK
jgi:hypothetical protein